MKKWVVLFFLTFIPLFNAYAQYSFYGDLFEIVEESDIALTHNQQRILQIIKERKTTASFILANVKHVDFLLSCDSLFINLPSRAALTLVRKNFKQRSKNDFYWHGF